MLLVCIGRLKRGICRCDAVQAGLFLREAAFCICKLLGQSRNLQIGRTKVYKSRGELGT